MSNETVLLVEDDDNYASTARDVFEDHGFDVRHAPDLVTAQDKATQADLYVVDLHFPFWEGSGNTSIGLKAMKKAVRQTKPGQAYLHAAKALTDNDVEEAIKFYEIRGEFDQFNHGSETVASIKRFAKATDDLPDGFSMDARMFLEENPLRFHHDFTPPSIYDRAKEELETDETQQPLGLLFLNEVNAQDDVTIDLSDYDISPKLDLFNLSIEGYKAVPSKPSIIATSEADHHNMITIYREISTTAIVETYMKRVGKDDAEFWEATLEQLDA